MGHTAYYPELKCDGHDSSLELLYVHMDSCDVIGVEEYNMRCMDTPDMSDWCELLDFIDILDMADILEEFRTENAYHNTPKQQEFWRRIMWLKQDRAC